MGVFPFSPEPGTPMGRMTGQIPDDVKQARVEELMLAQQQVAFAKARKQVGKTIQVLIDRPTTPNEEGNYVARSQSQAPDIDSVVFVQGNKLHPGQLLDVKVTDYQAYDLVAQVPTKKAKSLAVLKA